MNPGNEQAQLPGWARSNFDTLEQRVSWRFKSGKLNGHRANGHVDQEAVIAIKDGVHTAHQGTTPWAIPTLG
jgi:hypothetical protein